MLLPEAIFSQVFIRLPCRWLHLQTRCKFNTKQRITIEKSWQQRTSQRRDRRIGKEVSLLDHDWRFWGLHRCRTWRGQNSLYRDLSCIRKEKGSSEGLFLCTGVDLAPTIHFFYLLHVLVLDLLLRQGQSDLWLCKLDLLLRHRQGKRGVPDILGGWQGQVLQSCAREGPLLSWNRKLEIPHR